MSNREQLRPTLETAHKADRPERVPLHKQHAQVPVRARPGMHPVLVNDVIDSDGELRIVKYLKAGYTFMKEVEGLSEAHDVKFAGQEFYKGDGNFIRQRVSSSAHGKDTPTGIYMEIPEELFNQDQLDRKLDGEKQLEAATRPGELFGHSYGPGLNSNEKIL